MKGKHFLGSGMAAVLVVVLVAGLALAQVPAGSPVGTSFTYQGQLRSGEAPYTGMCDLKFGLWDGFDGGTQLGILTVTNVTIDAGYFTVQLDYGTGKFTGDARWLEISVRCPAGSGSYTLLSPRQALTAAPYVLALPGLWTEQNATSPNLIGGHSGNWVTSGVYGGTISGGGSDPDLNRVTDTFGTVGGGRANQAGDNAGSTTDQMYATVSGGSNNGATGQYATIGGGYTNGAIGQYATVAGGRDNAATGYVASVGGGENNTAGGDQATVAGGYVNSAGGSIATVGGGYSNSASGIYATVSGGYDNTAGGTVATVGGGSSNSASGAYATVAGGYDNSASGGYAAVPGGRNNVAQGAYSFAAGYRAKAYYDGSFVWSDSTEADYEDAGANTFNIRASSGANILADGALYGLTVHNTNGAGIGVGSDNAIGIIAKGGAGHYAGYFSGPIYTYGGCVGCVLIHLGLNDGAGALQPGDLAAISGLAEPVSGSDQPILRVHKAAAGEAAIGVVQARGVSAENAREDRMLESIGRAEGEIQPGDYLFLVVYGPTQVKVDASAGAIAVGTRLTSGSQPGHARALRTVTFEGVEVAEASPSVGIALEALDTGTGLISVFLTLN